LIFLLHHVHISHTKFDVSYQKGLLIPYYYQNHINIAKI
jgi:hypothetical protein